VRLVGFGDSALLVEVGDVHVAHRMARAVSGLPADDEWSAVEDVVVGLGSVTVRFDPRRVDVPALSERLTALAGTASLAGPPSAPAPAVPADAVVEIPVRFDGPDLDELSSLSGITPAHVVQLLAAAPLEVALLGFSPGFAYLQGLPPELADAPRRSRPRALVPAGSVAVGGGFAAVYPQATPGGWHLVGRTGTVLFDPVHPPYAVLSPGRQVRLRPTDEAPQAPAPFARPTLVAGGGRALLVERGGSCSLVQDGGRLGVAELGVPRAGAADQVAARLANRLVGNGDDDAVLEVTVSGPRLRATADCYVAVVADHERPGLVQPLVDGRPVPEAAVVPVSAGQTIELGRCDAAVRALLAVDGGMRTPVVLGSRSSDLLCGLGPGALEPGDALVLGPPRRPHGMLRVPTAMSVAGLRVLPGPDAPDEATVAGILAGEWRVRPDSNRVGIRLQRRDEAEAGREDGGSSGAPLPAQVASRGMIGGALQLPPGGEAIVLGPDHATVGGYPVAAVVVTADQHRLAHLRPGDPVRFVVVDDVEAAAALAALDRAVDAAVEGWFPTRTE
jgi:KipI family sensor histidine kinase inhibitor